MWFGKEVTIDVFDSLIPGKKDKNSSAGKWTQDLSIKLWVLYQLSYWGIHVHPLHAYSVSSTPNHQEVTNYV